MRHVALLVAMLMVAVVVARGQSPRNADMQKLADAFVAAWAKADAKGLAALHAENAIRSTPEGLIFVGRAAIEKAFAEALNGPLKGTTLVATPGEERTIGTDVIVATGTYEITGGNLPPGATTKGVYITTAVKQGGQWLVVSSSPVPVTAKPAAP